MPTRPKRPCTHPGCPELVTDSSRCPTYTVAYTRGRDKRRGTKTARGYDSAWRSVREQALRRDNYLCQRCLAEERVTPSTEVDHVIPISRGGLPRNLSATGPSSHTSSCV